MFSVTDDTKKTYGGQNPAPEDENQSIKGLSHFDLYEQYFYVYKTHKFYINLQFYFSYRFGHTE